MDLIAAAGFDVVEASTAPATFYLLGRKPAERSVTVPAGTPGE